LTPIHQEWNLAEDGSRLVDEQKHINGTSERSRHESSLEASMQAELSYRHVPLKKVKTIRVRYLPARPLPSRRIDIDEI